MSLEKQRESIKRIVKYVEDNIIGRLANRLADKRYNNIETLLEYVLKAGGGNHLEIGTLFGGSAIAVALLMEEFNLPGIVVCVDPLNGYYADVAPREDMVDIQSGEPVTPETFFKNVEKFEVQDRILLNKTYSPNYNLFHIPFITMFIDGNHKGTAPYFDAALSSAICSKYVIFDNYDSYHQDVRNACHIMSELSYWDHVYDGELVYVLERNENNSNR